MNILLVANGFVGELPGLGKTRKLEHLSEKRITKAVRARLRLEYRGQPVHVTCKAERIISGWRGQCTINGEQFGYTVSTKSG